MAEWERILESLGREGWHYAYIKCVDLEQGTDAYYVSIRRGDQKLTSLGSTLEEAVFTLNNLAGAAKMRGEALA